MLAGGVMKWLWQKACIDVASLCWTGESEQRLRQAFQAASDAAAEGQCVVLFLDEADGLCPVRHASRPHEARVVAQLLTLMDGLAPQSGKAPALQMCFDSARQYSCLWQSPAWHHPQDL